MGSSPIGVPSGNAGSIAHAKSKLVEYVRGMGELLQSFQPGSEEYKSLLSVLQTLNKIAPPSAAVPGMQATTMAGLNADAQKNAAMQMLSAGPAGSGAGGGGGQGASPASPPSPAMPPSLAA